MSWKEGVARERGVMNDLIHKIAHLIGEVGACVIHNYVNRLLFVGGGGVIFTHDKDKTVKLLYCM